MGQGAEGHGSPSEPISALRCNTLGAVTPRELQPECHGDSRGKVGVGRDAAGPQGVGSCSVLTAQPPAPGALPSQTPIRGAGLIDQESCSCGAWQ